MENRNFLKIFPDTETIMGFTIMILKDNITII